MGSCRDEHDLILRSETLKDMFKEMMGCDAPEILKDWMDANSDGTWRDEVKVGVLTGHVRYVGNHIEKVRRISRITDDGLNKIIEMTEDFLEKNVNWEEAEKLCV